MNYIAIISRLHCFLTFDRILMVGYLVGKSVSVSFVGLDVGWRLGSRVVGYTVTLGQDSGWTYLLTRYNPEYVMI